MDLKKFEEFMERYRTGVEKFEIWCGAMEDYFQYTEMGIRPDCDLALDILNEVFHDESHWIEYWVYDLDFGTRWTKGMITEGNGIDVPLHTVEDLYRLLMRNCNEEKVHLSSSQINECWKGEKGE